MIAWLVVPLILAALVFLARRRRRLVYLAPRTEGTKDQPLVRDRDPYHAVFLDMAQAWLTEPTIQKALVESGTCTKQWLEETEGDIGGYDEGSVYATVAVLTRNPYVRKVIARYHMKRFRGTTQFEAMHELLHVHEICSGKKRPEASMLTPGLGDGVH